MYLGAICHLHNLWIKDGENEGMKISFTLVCNDSYLAFVLNLLTFTYDFEFRSVLLKTLIPFSAVCSSLQQMYFYFERFNFLFV